MTNTEFIDKLCAYARTKLCSKAKSKAIQFALGAGTVGVGRRILESKISPFLSMCTETNGDIDLDGMKTSIMGGFDSAHSVPVMGGIISLDSSDAKDFFSYIGSPVEETASKSSK